MDSSKKASGVALAQPTVQLANENTSIQLKEFLLSEISSVRLAVNERDRLYMSKFNNADVAFRDMLLGQKTAVDAAFNASEKAIVKAEEAQKEYNMRSNEFRGQLSDQAQTLMARTEANVLIASVGARVDVNQKQIDELMLSKAKLEGKASQSQVLLSLAISFIGIVIGILGIILKFV